MTDTSAEAYGKALKQSGLEDLQPRCRRLLVQLRAKDKTAYDEAVEQYRSKVRSVSGDGNVLSAWIAYGSWLAERLASGKLVEISDQGLADDVQDPARFGASDQNPVAPGTMLIHLPDNHKRRAFVIAIPAEPSDAQLATAKLLCE